MKIKETIEGLIKQAENFGAGKTTLSMDYNDEWEALIVVKRKNKGN